MMMPLKLKIIDLQHEGKELKELREINEPISDICFSADDEQIFVITNRYRILNFWIFIIKYLSKLPN